MFQIYVYFRKWNVEEDMNINTPMAPEGYDPIVTSV